MLENKHFDLAFHKVKARTIISEYLAGLLSFVIRPFLMRVPIEDQAVYLEPGSG